MIDAGMEPDQSLFFKSSCNYADNAIDQKAGAAAAPALDDVCAAPEENELFRLNK